MRESQSLCRCQSSSFADWWSLPPGGEAAHSRVALGLCCRPQEPAAAGLLTGSGGGLLWSWFCLGACPGPGPSARWDTVQATLGALGLQVPSRFGVVVRIPQFIFRWEELPSGRPGKASQGPWDCPWLGAGCGEVAAAEQLGSLPSGCSWRVCSSGGHHWGPCQHPHLVVSWASAEGRSLLLGPAWLGGCPWAPWWLQGHCWLPGGPEAMASCASGVRQPAAFPMHCACSPFLRGSVRDIVGTARPGVGVAWAAAGLSCSEWPREREEAPGGSSESLFPLMALLASQAPRAVKHRCFSRTPWWQLLHLSCLWSVLFLYC